MPGKMQAAPPHHAAHGMAWHCCAKQFVAIVYSPSCMALRHCNALTVSVPLPAHARYGGMK
jgi:hypothetical protein